MISQQNFSNNLSSEKWGPSLFENNGSESRNSFYSSESYELIKAKYTALDLKKCQKIIVEAVHRSCENLDDCIKNLNERRIDIKKYLLEIGNEIKFYKKLIYYII